MKAENITRLSIYTLTAIGTALSYEIQNAPYFIMMFFIFILNSRIRLLFLTPKNRNNLLLVSIISDLALVFLLSSKYPYMTYFLLYITILDSLSLLKSEGYILSIIASAFILFYIKEKGPDIFILNLFIILSLSIFSINKKNLNKDFKETEILFDENRRYSYELENTKKILEDYSSKIESLSTLQERARITSEIHDNLGHKLTGVLFQLEAGMRVSKKDLEKGLDIIESSRATLSSTVDMLSDTLKNINPGEYSNRVLSIKQMIDDFIYSSNIDISFDIKGTPVKLYPSMEVALYKNAKEAITNSARHGKSKKIWITLKYEEKQVILTVIDDGISCKTLVRGMGIKGMEERVKIIDGELFISTEKGFEITTIIPIKS
ncbi:sensor histidine kinase [Clostridium intestinale]|uniref:histidine kinase n=1 Tax=Clostridium intestinale DSM 6191 TaxID=1121320 RepID=A0A1M5WI34_9CLOT|nr:sensor histidine kinase [Clostridium intestinale]SHH86874.1 Signal transduction histidine kinase [Clostridium intestinale DSM 6191]